MVKELKIKPPHPDDLFFGVFEPDSKDCMGLRRNKNNAYYLFLKHFLKAAVGLTPWKKKSTTQLISNYVEEPKEAFAVVSYKNGYNVWYNDYCHEETVLPPDAECESSLESSIEKSQATYEYTGSTRGVRKHQGWSQEGMKMYNQVAKVIEIQRKEENSLEIENMVLRDLLTEGGGKRKDNGNNDEVVKPASKLQKLMNLMDVRTTAAV